MKYSVAVGKVKAVSVPGDASYVTEGEIYNAEFEDDHLFKMVDDDGDIIWCRTGDKCGHGISWERVYD